eukprot:3405333-Rhodomonas_salina.2
MAGAEPDEEEEEAEERRACLGHHPGQQQVHRVEFAAWVGHLHLSAADAHSSVERPGRASAPIIFAWETDKGSGGGRWRKELRNVVMGFYNYISPDGQYFRNWAKAFEYHILTAKDEPEDKPAAAEDQPQEDAAKTGSVAGAEALAEGKEAGEKGGAKGDEGASVEGGEAAKAAEEDVGSEKKDEMVLDEQGEDGDAAMADVEAKTEGEHAENPPESPVTVAICRGARHAMPGADTACGVTRTGRWRVMGGRRRQRRARFACRSARAAGSRNASSWTTRSSWAARG